MVSCPGLDSLHRRLFDRELSAFDERTPYRAVRVTVLVSVADTDRLSAVEENPAGTLDMQKKKIDGIVTPQQLLAAQRRLSVFDLAALVIGHNSSSVELPTQSHPFQFRV